MAAVVVAVVMCVAATKRSHSTGCSQHVGRMRSKWGRFAQVFSAQQSFSQHEGGNSAVVPVEGLRFRGTDQGDQAATSKAERTLRIAEGSSGQHKGS